MKKKMKNMRSARRSALVLLLEVAFCDLVKLLVLRVQVSKLEPEDGTRNAR